MHLPGVRVPRLERFALAPMKGSVLVWWTWTSFIKYALSGRNGHFPVYLKFMCGNCLHELSSSVSLHEEVASVWASPGFQISNLTWTYVWYIQVFEGLLLAGLFFLVVNLAGRILKTFSPISRALARPAKMPPLITKAARLCFASGAVSFGVLAGLDILREPVPKTAPIVRWAFNVIQTTLLGQLAFTSMLVAVVGLTFYRSPNGLLTSFCEAITSFAAPSVLIVELAIFTVAPWDIFRQVTNFTKPLAIYGIYLITNWFVLIVAACLVTLQVREQFSRPRDR